MIRVGFILSYTDSSWVGGINYLSNLLHAVMKVSDRQIEPVLIVPPNTPVKILEAFPPCEILRTILVDGKHRSWSLARKLSERLLGRDMLMERFLFKNRINVLSHSGQLGRRATVPTIGWLADFQHRRMPEFFQPAELAARDRGCRRISEQCTVVLLSSHDAQQDLAKFDPDALPYSRVLHFVAGFSGGETPIVDELVLRKRYNITTPYFHLPNQFWRHKNHRVVIDALSLMKKSGHPTLVLCTGHTNDRRWPGYFDELMAHAQDMDVVDCFRVLGLVPYEDMASLMRQSAGIINPSMFEGWSTTVEEAKSLGLNIVLSDIPVHREQNPERGVFFDPLSPSGLAGVLHTILEKYIPDTEMFFNDDAKEKLHKRFLNFGNNYQCIALEASLKKSICRV